MKRMKLLSVAVISLCSLMLGCKSTGERELTGYEFKKEYASTEKFSDNQLTGSITVDMYIQLHSYPTGWTSIISKLKSDKENEFCIRIKDAQRAQWYYGTGSSAIVLEWVPSDVLPLNEWVRLTAVRDMGTKTMELYVNGNSVAKETYKSLKKAAKTESKVIMMAHGKRQLNGTLAEMRIWTKPMTEADINKTAGLVKNPEKDNTLYGYWLFDSVEDGVSKDLSGNGNDASIQKIE